ncbi:MAG: hypothetical protein GX046_08235 [Tissierellia bacterium]|jgi:hypothetical protein|nr:hypothetical protein [Tissierellia bacterium]
MKNYYEYTDYTVIIGDIIDSKEIEDRKNAQTKFKKILADINEKYSEDIASKFTIVLGDEFQGLLKNRNNIIKIIFEIEMAMAPIALRFGVGIGEVSTDINYEYSSEIDGPAYHRARAMMENLQSSKSQYSKRQANILISSQVGNAEIDKLLNSILSVCTALKSKWTLRQTEIIGVYLKSEENQYKAAEKLEIGQSSVNKALNSANFYTYKSAMDSVNLFLSEKGED